MTIVAALMTVFFIMQPVGQVPAALWVIFGEDRFRWSATMIGLSLRGIRNLHALAQAFVTGPPPNVSARSRPLSPAWRPTRHYVFGVRDARLDGLPIMILLASGGIDARALQAMLSRQVDDDHQGQLQGSLAALTSLTRSLDR
ncbi:MFS transporter [Brucella pituitosa]|uniref:MFS transporter n=1 Tax=Brucella pituitosa TaxID=571256 RepID=UPI0020921F9B|nr:MFS transporter [Brucella pituitosa]